MRALVVDDSKPSRSIVARVLRDLNFECLEAGNGAEALQVLGGGGRPDVVTVNWHMPVMDGIEFVGRLRADPVLRGLRILMISTEHDRERIAAALATGIDDYLAKPFTADALTRKLVEMGVCAAADAAVKRIRVLVCDDSATIRAILCSTLGEDAEIEVAGTAVNGQVCLDIVGSLNPDVVLLDVEMPVMDGLTALKELRRRLPKLPVVMFSSLTERGAKATVDALLSGANDYVAKPAGLDPGEVATRIRTEVAARIKAVAPRRSVGPSVATRPTKPGPQPATAARREAIRAVVIAVSTGGPAALAEVLPSFAKSAPVPVLIVQHMPATFTGQLADRLTKICGIPVREAVDGTAIGPGNVVLAAGGRHLEVAGDLQHPRVAITDGPPENSCRPSADVLFRSAVKLWGGGTLGVVLTGMGRDGLAGSRAVVEAGGGVVVQDESSSVVWGMPGEVARAGLADAVLPLSQVGVEIALRLKRRSG